MVNNVEDAGKKRDILLTGCSTPSYKLLHSLHVVEGGKVDEKSYEKWHDLCMPYKESINILG